MDVDWAKLHVLVIDDEKPVRQLVARLLDHMGVGKVATAKDGSQGLFLLESAEPGVDLIICDLRMPKMDGIEFVRRVREGRTVPDPKVPILILTGHADEKSIKDFKELGINGFLVKPVSRNTFATYLSGALRREKL